MHILSLSSHNVRSGKALLITSLFAAQTITTTCALPTPQHRPETQSVDRSDEDRTQQHHHHHHHTVVDKAVSLHDCLANPGKCVIGRVGLTVVKAGDAIDGGMHSGLDKIHHFNGKVKHGVSHGIGQVVEVKDALLHGAKEDDKDESKIKRDVFFLPVVDRSIMTAEDSSGDDLVMQHLPTLPYYTEEDSLPPRPINGTVKLIIAPDHDVLLAAAQSAPSSDDDINADADKLITHGSGTRDDPIVIEKRSIDGSEYLNEVNLIKRQKKDPIINTIKGAVRAPNGSVLHPSTMLYDGEKQKAKYQEMEKNHAARQENLLNPKGKSSKAGKVMKWGVGITGVVGLGAWGLSKWRAHQAKAQTAPTPPESPKVATVAPEASTVESVPAPVQADGPQPASAAPAARRRDYEVEEGKAQNETVVKRAAFAFS
ncbi:hypothetical protein CBS101457_006913 [Exobasidium rhododendri]|nr:hypothetical protein CBS101457_006913 [Exobasidium rhododendri]